MSDEVSTGPVLIAGLTGDGRVLAGLLRSAGVETHVARSAASARTYLRRHSAAVLVADVDLGGPCGGFDLAMVLRMDSSSHHTRIVLVSAVRATGMLLGRLTTPWIPCNRFVPAQAGAQALLGVVQSLLRDEPAARFEAPGLSGPKEVER